MIETPFKGKTVKVNSQVVTSFEGRKVGLFKKHVIVKVREGTVKGSVKVFSKVAQKVDFLGFGCEGHEKSVNI